MNNSSKKIIPILLLLLCTCLLGLHLQATQEATFFYREQQQIFLFDSEYVLNILKTIGGLATICSQFIIQFFKVPLIGSLVTALIGGVSGWLFWLTLRKIHPALYLLPLAFLPILFQYLYLIKDSYHYEGLIAMLFWSLALSLYSYGTRKFNWTYRTLIGCLLAIGLFYTMGSVAVLFVLSILLFDILQKSERWYASFIPLLLLLIVGSLCVLGGSKPDYDYVFWMKDYVEYFIELEPFYGFSWQIALLVMLLFFLSRYLDHIKTYLKALVAVALLALSGIYYTQTALQQRNKDFYALMQMFHYIDTEQWDAIISSADLNYNNYLHLNCLNLALSHKGVIQTDLFKYPQSGIQSLVSKYQAHIEESFLFSQIYYHVGITSLAYNFAFGTSVGITHGSPVMTKLLIKSHLIYGQYPAAEKFISLLEKTWAYHEWASSQRKFLYNDLAVENDPELGTKRKSLSSDKDLFANIIGLFDNLMIILEENPQNKAALDYTIGILLLSKDLPAIKMFVERFSGTEVLPTLPEPLQQAVISYAEHDPDYCRKYGVTDKVLSEFSLFKQRVLGLRHARQDITAGIADYRPTFWYYLILSK
ncbi:DUF6057 family protein [Parabacteroides distasonis]|uniref:Transmembrane protein n=1 Tax=Parabacteroides distasonis TaxID=823 RepID=A0A3L7ZPX8_PARDI|nr:DUF6057 family protein [Parabacteroides distasonis]NBH89079.1 hypothetical protein [Parabacteroides distasonis]RLT72967.1 hypothetical protein D7V78_12955 [Parabacteroides distasonis]